MKKHLLTLLFLLSVISLLGQTKVTTAEVNFRSAPEITATKICTIPKGTVLSVVDSGISLGVWLAIRYHGEVGYIHSAYVKQQSTAKPQIRPGSTHKKRYSNTARKRTQSSTYDDGIPNGATAVCNDGTYSYSQNHRGTCSHHGGVKKWLK